MSSPAATAAPLPADVTMTPIGSGATEVVTRGGRELGDVTSGAPGSPVTATIATGRFATYRFPTREAAVAAMVSYADRGHWVGEV